MNAILNKIRFGLLKLFSGFINNTTNPVIMKYRTTMQINKLGVLISQCSGITLEELIITKKSRKQEYVKARQVHMACLKTGFNLSQEKAGRMYYDKDHATMRHAIKAVNDELDTNAMFREQYREALWYVYTINPKRVTTELHVDWLINPKL